ncbi:MAG: DUF3299 domain-containing protein [Deltaproteobacteria bacterium]|jgi:hypothetical protein|nr:DUF3299 domain-containing protein [Deltaproteobacteria bacterium]
MKSILNRPYFIAGCLFLFILGGAFFYVFSTGKSLKLSGKETEVDWRLLGEMDYITGKSPAELEKLNHKEVKVPGFMVPLEDNSKMVTEFLLVPTPQACIHVPAPPPNQMVYVKMRNSHGAEVPMGPIWVYGELNMVTKKSMYGDASFEILGDRVEAYK